MTLISISGTAFQKLHAQSPSATQATLHPRTLNKLLKAGAQAWGMSLGSVHQAYADGRITWQAGEYSGTSRYFSLWLDNDCLITPLLEDIF